MKAGMGYVSAVRNESSIAGADGSVPRDVLACDVRPASRSVQWSVRGLRLLWLHVPCPVRSIFFFPRASCLL
jgi:hypothetical protein